MWGQIVARCHIVVFIVFLGLLTLAGYQNVTHNAINKDQKMWVPKDNRSWSVFNQAKKDFSGAVDENLRLYIKIAFESKEEGRLLTLEAFQDMIDFEQETLQVSYTTPEDQVMTYENLCVEFFDPSRGDEREEQKVCRIVTARPIDMVFDIESDSFDLSKYETDQDLLKRIQQGQTELTVYRKKIVEVLDIFGGMTPQERLYQNPQTGRNNIESATVAIYEIKVKQQPHRKQWLYRLAQFIDKFNAEDRSIVVSKYFEDVTINEEFAQIQEDTQVAYYAIGILMVYLVVFIGSFSPIHCRMTVSFVGLVCIIISVGAGFGISAALGFERTMAHQALPILMLGIGVDDMFVICNALDQSSLKLTPRERLIDCMRHAGPSITITSVTDALAFVAGSSSSLPGLSSFCVYSAICVLMLYLTVMTIFLTVIYWDTWRVSTRRKECCGLFCCKEDSFLFCKGKMLSNSQKEFSRVEFVEQMQQVYEMTEPSQSNTTQVIASNTERFLLEKVAPVLLQTKVKVAVLLIYAIFTTICIIGLLDIRIYYSQELSVVDDSYTSYQFLQTRDKYFGFIYHPVILVKLNDSVDFYSEEAQFQQLQFEEALTSCTTCSKQWFKSHTLDSWFDQLRGWIDEGNCAEAPNGIDPFKKTMEKSVFQKCLQHAYKENYGGSDYWKDIIVDEDLRITGFHLTIKTVEIDEPGKYLTKLIDDLRYMEQNIAHQGTYSFQRMYVDAEVIQILRVEIYQMFGYALLAVSIVVLFITFNVRMTVIVVSVVALVTVYMTAICHFWGLTLSHIFAVNMTFALGIAIDFSLHIAHKYMVIVPPTELKSNKEKREYKTTKAISVMGSSVFHGGFSTLLAISSLAFAKNYHFQVFFKTWITMIFFGMLNGLILQPIVLSLIGPVQANRSHDDADVSQQISQVDANSSTIQMKSNQIADEDGSKEKTKNITVSNNSGRSKIGQIEREFEDTENTGRENKTKICSESFLPMINPSSMKQTTLTKTTILSKNQENTKQ